MAAYGHATITILDEQFEELDNGCFAVARTEEIQLQDATGTLTLSEQGTFCRPGGSGKSHATPTSYGAPGVFRFAYTIAGGTGSFSSASGTGSITMNVAGAVGVWHLHD